MNGRGKTGNVPCGMFGGGWVPGIGPRTPPPAPCPLGWSAIEAEGCAPCNVDGARLRSKPGGMPTGTQLGGGGGGGGGGDACSRLVIRVAVSVVLERSVPKDWSVVDRQASNPFILSSICCIMSWKPLMSSAMFSTLLAIFACNDGGFFFGARPKRLQEKKNSA